MLDKNVKLRIKGNKQDLIKDLKSSRSTLVPGHKVRFFVWQLRRLELCTNVTLGYGSLYERVEHNVTGFVAKNLKNLLIMLTNT